MKTRVLATVCAAGFALLAASGCATTREEIGQASMSFDKTEDGPSIKDRKIEKYLNLHRDFPDEPKYPERLSRLYLAKGDHQNALSYLQEAREIDPKNPKYDFIEARTMLGIGNMVGAEKAYMAMIAHTPKNFPGPRFELGWLYYQLGRDQEAKTRLLEATSIDASLPDPHYYLAQIAMRERDKVTAVKEFENYLKLEGRAYAEDALVNLRRLQPELYRYDPE